MIPLCRRICKGGLLVQWGVGPVESPPPGPVESPPPGPVESPPPGPVESPPPGPVDIPPPGPVDIPPPGPVDIPPPGPVDIPPPGPVDWFLFQVPSGQYCEKTLVEDNRRKTVIIEKRLIFLFIYKEYHLGVFNQMEQFLIWI